MTRYNRAKVVDRRRVFFENCGNRRNVGLASKWSFARRHLVEHDAERKHIGACVDRFALGLLWRHVCDGAEYVPFGGCRFVGYCNRARFVEVGVEHLCETKVENLHTPGGVAHDVRGFDVAVHDALAVRRGKRVGNGDRQVEEFFER